MEHVSIIPAHSMATWLLANIDNFLDFLGLGHHHTLEQIIYFIIIVGISYLIGWVIQKIILVFTRRFVKLRNTSGARELLRQKTLSRCAHFIPPLVFLSLAPFAFESKSAFLSIIIKISVVYLIVTLAIGISAILEFAFTRVDEKQNVHNLPIRGILNVARGIVWIIALIIAVSVVVHKSPAALLGGMTAFAAVLMLIFKDSILGFVAGIQMSQNDMLHVGDWIVVPSTPANGTVVDVSLTTVKVQNFDNTIVTVPPYTLVSSSFQNWRGMSKSGVRRVCQNVYINPDTVVRPTADKLQQIGEKYPEMKAFIDQMQTEGKLIKWEAGNAPLNGTIETNLGLYRAYLTSYLLKSDMVDATRDLMVCMQPMTHEGVPMQIYFFAVTTQWEQYEAVRSGIMEHALAAAADFDLEILSADHLNVTTGEK